jgi:hypothetical protein
VIYLICYLLKLTPENPFNRNFPGSAWLFNYQKSKKNTPQRSWGAVTSNLPPPFTVGYKFTLSYQQTFLSLS